MAGTDDIDNLNNSANRATSSLNDLERATQAVTQVERDEVLRKKELKDAFKSLFDATSKLNKGFAQYADSITFGTGKIGGFIKDLGDGFAQFPGGIQRAFGGVLKATGGVISSGADLAKAALEQHDNLVKAYRGLSEFGAIDSSGIEGLQNTLADIGTTAENVDYFKEALSKAAPELAIFGGSVAGGAKELTGVVKGLLDNENKYENKLTQFGYTTEDLMKYSATFISLNSRNMQGLNKDTNALQQATYNYMKDLSELAELTGQSRDQQVAAQKELQNEFGWRLKLRQMAEEGPEGKRQSDKAERLMTSLSISDPELGKTIRDIMLHDGGTTTAETTMKAGQFPETVKEFVNQLKNTSSAQESYAQIGNKLSQESGIALKRFGYQATFGGESLRDMAMSTNVINNAERTNWLESSKRIKQNTEAMEGEADARLKAQTEMQKRQRMIVNTYEDVFFSLGDKGVKSVNAFLTAMTWTARQLVEKTEMITGKKMTDRFSGEKYLANTAALQSIQEERTDLEKKIKETEADKVRHQKENNAAQVMYDNLKLNGMKEELDRINKKEQREKANQVADLENANKEKAINEAKNFAMKSGLQWEKEKMNPAVLDLMSRLQKVPGFKEFTSANEKERQSGKLYSELHAKGQGFDFTDVSGKSGKPLDPSQRKMYNDVIEQFKKDTGAEVLFKDEYMNRSKNATGGHVDIKVIPRTNMSGAPTTGKIENAPIYEPDKNTSLAKANIPTTNNANIPNTAGSNVTSDQAVSLLAAMNIKLDSMNTILDRSLRGLSDIAEHTKHTATALG